MGSFSQPYFVAISLSLTYLYPSFESIFTDSLCAAREHSYQLSKTSENSMGGIHCCCPPKKEHIHIIKANLTIDKFFKSPILS